MNITIIGTGLIGGSLAIRLREKQFAKKIIGVDRNTTNLKKALELGLIDEGKSLDEAIAESDVIVLTIPVDGIRSLLPTILDKIKPQQVVIEMGSTKAELLSDIQLHPKRGRLVASHPMAGTEYSGPDAAIPNLFKHKTMVFTNVIESDEDAFEVAEAICDMLEMKPVYMNAEEHDLHAAYVSHISHITSFALALTVLKKEKSQGRIFELAGGGFESTVRLAKSSAEMWVPIFQQNRKNIIAVLSENIRQLQHMLETLEEEDYENFTRLIKQANKIKRILK